MSSTKHKNKFVYEKVLMVKSIHNSEDSTNLRVLGITPRCYFNHLPPGVFSE